MTGHGPDMADATTTSFISRTFDRTRLEQAADWLAVAVVATMPWSTSVSQVLTVVWLVALIPTLDVAPVRRELQSAAGGLPALLWVLALAGLLWADVPWTERIAGLGGFHKLLVIPLLLVQFRRSERGIYVLAGFLISCVLLLGVSAIVTFPRFYVSGKMPGIPVRDYIAQSTEFLICAFALLGFAIGRQRQRQWISAAMAALLAGLFLADIFSVATGRTALVVIPLLLLALGFRYFGWRGVLAACLAAIVIGAAAWVGSPFLRDRVTRSVTEVQDYETRNAISSSGIRLEIWKKSLTFIATAPLFGHGTGSIPDQFRRVAVGGGVSGLEANNPHNQIFAVAIQLGMLGTAVLIAMWLAHLMLFRGSGLIAWVGIVIVVQNIVSSLFNSHLFDSFHGWLYVFGLGVVGGMALRERANDRAGPP